MNIGSKVFYSGLGAVAAGATILIASSGNLGLVALGIIVLLLGLPITFWGVLLKWGPNFMSAAANSLSSTLDQMNEQMQDRDGKK